MQHKVVYVASLGAVKPFHVYNNISNITNVDFKFASGNDNTIVDDSNLFSMFSTKIRTFLPFTTRMKFINNDSVRAIIDEDNTRIKDTGSAWYTISLDHGIAWGTLFYYELILETFSNNFIMTGLRAKNEMHLDTCLSSVSYFTFYSLLA
jgi:hypothetical protein